MEHLNLLKGSGKAFCSGADVVVLHQLINEGGFWFTLISCDFLCCCVIRSFSTAVLFIYIFIFSGGWGRKLY